MSEDLDAATLANYRREIERATATDERARGATAAVFAALDKSDRAWQALRSENERLRAALGEINTDIAQAMLESSYPLHLLPVEDARLALQTIAARASRALAR